MKKTIICALCVLVLFGLVGCNSTSNQTEIADVKEDSMIYATVTTNSGETKQMTLQEIVSVKNSNKVLFEDEYVGADITVTSAITKIGGAYKLTYWFECDAYLEMESGSYATFFKPITRDEARTYNVGQTVTVSGKIGMASDTFHIYILKDKISPY